MSIRRDDPVRAAFSECSSGNGPNRYYKTKGRAIRAFEAALNDFGYHLGHDSLPNGEGRHLVDVYVDGGGCVGYAVIYYYRMSSGRWEFIAYIA